MLNIGPAMDFKEKLSARQSKVTMQEIVTWVNNNQQRFDALMVCFFSESVRLSQNTAWPVGKIGEKQPQLLYKHLKKMLDNLDNPVHDAVVRNTLRTLQFIKIPKEHQGQAANKCFEYLSDHQYPVAFRIFSMSVLWNIGQEEPDLLPELALVIEEQLPFGTSGIKARGAKILKQIGKQKTKYSL